MIGHKDCRCPGCGRCDAAERDAARRSASPALAKARNERDAAIAERDRLRAALEERDADMHARVRAGYDATIADCWRAAIAKVEAERDRLRRELEALRDEARSDTWHIIVDGHTVGEYVADCLGAILRGES